MAGGSTRGVAETQPLADVRTHQAAIRTALVSVALAPVAGAALPLPNAVARPAAHQASHPAVDPADDERRAAKHVVLVDWDGFDPDYLDRVPTPNLDALVAGGSLSIATGTYPTVSNPSRASLSTGAYPRTHRNVAHAYDQVRDRATGQTRFLAARTIAEVLAADGRSVASVQWYMVENRGVRYGDARHLYVQPGGACSARVDAAVAILRGTPVDSGGQRVVVRAVPDLLAVYCSDLDTVGHREGPDSVETSRTMAQLDRQLGRLVGAIAGAGIARDTAFIVTGDHGMSPWTRTLVPPVEAALRTAGHHPQVLYAGERPRPGTDVVIVGAERVGTVALRGTAASAVGRASVTRVLSRLPQVSRVLDSRRLRALHATPKQGDLVIEAKPPWAFVRRSLPRGRVRGAHGSLAEIKVPLVLAGSMFCGRAPGDPELVDVAPTIATLLGVPVPPQAEGRVLGEAMRSRSCRRDARAGN